MPDHPSYPPPFTRLDANGRWNDGRRPTLLMGDRLPGKQILRASAGGIPRFARNDGECERAAGTFFRAGCKYSPYPCPGGPVGLRRREPSAAKRPRDDLTQCRPDPSALLRQEGGAAQTSLNVVVEVELPGMRSYAHGIRLIFPLVGDPSVDEVLGEDAALQQVGVVFFQVGERLIE